MFKNFVSLGNWCVIASSMSKYGLRNWSGVFDWLITPDLACVLHYMENDFEDFLKKENLVRYEKEYPAYFKDRVSGVRFTHDNDTPFDTDYDKLNAKYQRRIQKFIEETKSSTCFLRAILCEEDIKYAVENAEYIQRVISKNNNQNEIVFLVKKEIGMPDIFPFRYFHMVSEFSGANQTVLSSWFDGAEAFRKFCAENFSAKQIMDNIEFDWMKKNKTQEIISRRYRLLAKICEYDYDSCLLPEEIVIYGAGKTGQIFYRNINNKCRVSCFIDQKEAGKEFSHIPILRIKELDKNKAWNIIVTATYDFDKIKSDLKGFYKYAQIISLDELLA